MELLPLNQDMGHPQHSQDMVHPRLNQDMGHPPQHSQAMVHLQLSLGMVHLQLSLGMVHLLVNLLLHRPVIFILELHHNMRLLQHKCRECLLVAVQQHVK